MTADDTEGIIDVESPSPTDDETSDPEEPLPSGPTPSTLEDLLQLTQRPEGSSWVTLPVNPDWKSRETPFNQRVRRNFVNRLRHDGFDNESAGNVVSFRFSYNKINSDLSRMRGRKMRPFRS